GGPSGVEARGPRRDRRLGRDGLRVPRDRGAPGRRGCADLGAGADRRLRLGEGAGSVSVGSTELTTTAGAAVVDLASTPLRELNQRLHELAGQDPSPRRWEVQNP